MVANETLVTGIYVMMQSRDMDGIKPVAAYPTFSACVAALPTAARRVRHGLWEDGDMQYWFEPILMHLGTAAQAPEPPVNTTTAR